MFVGSVCCCATLLVVNASSELCFRHVTVNSRCAGSAGIRSAASALWRLNVWKFIVTLPLEAR